MQPIADLVMFRAALGEKSLPTPDLTRSLFIVF